MKRGREPKKSETLEVRLPHEVKTALMRKAQTEGRSASDVVRESIGAYLAERPKEARSMLMTFWKPAAALSLGATALAWSALTAGPAMAGPDLRAAFERFDADRDGVVTADEFRRGHADDRFIVHQQGAQKPSAPVMIPLHHARPAPAEGGPVPLQLLAQEFARQDADRSGSVSFSEFEAFHITMMKTAFGNMDANKDGGVDERELAAVIAQLPKGAPHARFAELDRDKNGTLSQDEFFVHTH